MTTSVVAESVLDCVRQHAGTASTSTVVGALVDNQTSETEIMNALRWLLQSGDLQMGATMHLELGK